MYEKKKLIKEKVDGEKKGKKNERNMVWNKKRREILTNI